MLSTNDSESIVSMHILFFEGTYQYASAFICLSVYDDTQNVMLTISCRSANLILNLFGLMVDTNVQDIAMEPDKVVKKVST